MSAVRFTWTAETILKKSALESTLTHVFFFCPFGLFVRVTRLPVMNSFLLVLASVPNSFTASLADCRRGTNDFTKITMSHNHMAHMMNVSNEHTAHDTHASYQAMDHSSMHSSMDHVSDNHGSMETNVNLHGLHGMSMTFHGGYSENVLFESWKISSVSGLIGSMIGIIIMAALYEGLKYYREYLFWKMYNSLQYRSVTMPQEKNVVAEDNRVVHTIGEVIHKQPPTMLSWMHMFQTFLHIVQIVLSYFLMLIFMTYNVWLCFAVVFGAAIGYFLFGWKKSVIVDVTEHCH